MSAAKTEAAAQNPTAKATAKFVRVTPMKARRVIDLVRGKSVDEALDILLFAPQAASEPVAKVVASAAANAENNLGLDRRTLVVTQAFADEGPTMKRFRPRAQGRAFRIRKRTSHITVVVESVSSAALAARSRAKTPKKAEAQKATAKTSKGAQ